jgi:hypothetical protein
MRPYFQSTRESKERISLHRYIYSWKGILIVKSQEGELQHGKTSHENITDEEHMAQNL